MHMTSLLPPIALAVLSLALPAAAFAQWSTSPNVNNAICVTANQQQAPRVVSDGSGGAIITWWDLNLTTSDYGISAQRIDAGGVVQWTVNGIAVCANSALQHVPEMTSDGNGGAIIAWQDNRSGSADIYAQRVNGSGAVQWAADGVPVCAATSDQTSPQLIADGNGGAIVVWQDLRGGTNYVPYAQKLNAAGAAQWTVDGVLLSATGTAETPQIVSDGNGGAIMAWHQYNSGDFDIYAQHITANGLLGWGSNGVVACALTSKQLRPQIAGDGAGGAIIVWEDYRNVSYSNLYAQRLNAVGVVQWTVNGVAVAPNTLSQIRQRLLSDGSGGVFVAWQYGNNLVYAQRMSSNGAPLWAADGVSIGAAGDSRYPDLATDGASGAIVTWYDYRGSGNGDIFAQRITSAGAVLWVTNGIGVCRDPAGQVFPRLVAGGNGSSIIAWDDSRNSATGSTDIYAQRINAGGTLGGATGVDEIGRAPTSFSLDQNFPNPFNPSTTIRYGVPQSSHVSLIVYNFLGQQMAVLVEGAQGAGRHEVQFEPSGLSSGLYYYRLKAGEHVETRRMLLLK